MDGFYCRSDLQRQPNERESSSNGGRKASELANSCWRRGAPALCTVAHRQAGRASPQPMTFYNQRAFVRPEGEEEISPPSAKMRSYDSLSVAAILQGKLDLTAQVGMPPAECNPPRPSSPTVDAAAAVLASAR